MTRTWRRQLAEIQGGIYLVSRLPREKWPQRLLELIAELKKILHEYEKRQKRDLQPVKRCLTLLVASLDGGHVSIVSVKDKEVWDYAIGEAKRLLEDSELW